VSGSRSRNKGHRFEREMAVLLRQRFPHLADKVRRGVDQAQDGGESPDVEGLPDWWVECKRGRATNPRAALIQAQTRLDQLGDPRHPVAITRDDHGQPMATIWLEDWLQLIAPALAQEGIVVVTTGPAPSSGAPPSLGAIKEAWRETNLCLRCSKADMCVVGRVAKDPQLLISVASCLPFSERA